MPRSPRRRSDKRLAQITGDTPWLLFVGVLTVFALIFQLYPALIERSAVGVAFPPLLVRVWASLLLVGCVLVYVSLWKLNASWDVAGSLMLASWSLSYAYTVFAVRGPAAGFVASSVFAAVFALCMARAFVLAYEPQVTRWRSRQ